MDSLATLFGIRGPSAVQPPPYYSAYYLTFSFLFAFGVTSSRVLKRIYRMDHQVSPRGDTEKYGPAAVAKGKITQKQLDQLRRVEAAHANSVEHFPLFAATMLFAHVAKLRPEVINATGLAYVVARVLYAGAYVFIDSEALSAVRGLLWWASNIICIRTLLLSGQAINGNVA